MPNNRKTPGQKKAEVPMPDYRSSSQKNTLVGNLQNRKRALASALDETEVVRKKKIKRPI